MDCVYFIEKFMKVELLPHQKEIIKGIESKKIVCVCYPPRNGYSYYLKTINEFNRILYGGGNGKTDL